MNKKFKTILTQFIKFGMVGVINTVLSYLITNGCYYILHLHEQISNLISFLITVLISYLLNSRFVFCQEEGSRQPWYRALAKVYASYALTELVLMGILLFIQERLFGVPHYIATFVNLCVTVPLNFLLNKFWAYRKSEGSSNIT
ncbi:MAG: GtrA family protein [Lachnospiraceae bacterium]|nr:GtrA family protein [uncultured Acetatifactor sp.]MCI8286647.1 GtrA family protein [Lachnospiraceae bacterium]